MTSIVGGELSTSVKPTSSGSGTNVGMWAVNGLKGANNTGNSTTQFDCSADSVTLYNPSTSAITVRTNTGILTNDTSIAGPTANGRDQAGAFSVSSWIHFYFIWNGTTLATLSSAIAPPTGPTLPSGYTHWAYLGAIRFNGSSQLQSVAFNGSWASIIENNGGANRLLNAGAATSFTTLTANAIIPPNSLLALFFFQVGNGGEGGLYIRPVGSTLGQGRLAAYTAATVYEGSALTFPLNSSQQIQYKIDNVIGNVAFIDVLSYQMPNGGE